MRDLIPNTINWIVKKVVKHPTIVIRMSKNEFDILHFQTGKSISKKANQEFSTDRLIIAEPIIAEKFCRELIDELLGVKGKPITKPLEVILQVVNETYFPISTAEKMIYRDLAMYIGASCVWIIDDHLRKLNHTEIEDILSGKTKYID